MNILIIEDEPSIRQTLQDLLELNGHTVLVAENGAAGIGLAGKRPEMILCDIGLPDMDGYGVIEAIRAIPECSDIPFIFLTARASRNDQRLGMSLGADDYITKPFTESEIVDAIAARIRRQTPLRERLEKVLTERLSVAGAKWSHELLTPLNGILGGLEMIEMEAETIQPAELKAMLGLIRASAERQQDLSRKLLFHYELERKKNSGAPKKVYECEAAFAIGIGASEVAKKENRTADLIVECKSGDVLIAESYLVSAVSELVENAFRFSKPGQPVRVEGGSEGGRYKVHVTDCGVGMTAADCAAVSPFTVFESGRSGRQGIGLGLALVKGIVEQAGGKFQVEPGHTGIRVTLELPVA